MDQSAKSKRLTAEGFLLFTVVIWAANYPLAKFGLSGLHPFVFNAIRYVVAALVLWLVTLMSGPPVKVERRDFSRLLGAGMVASILYQVVFIVGLAMSTAGNSAVILSTSPLWTVLLHARIHREKISPPVWIGTLLSLTGVLLIILGSGKKVGFGSEEFAGDCILLVAAALWGLNTNLQKPLLQIYSATHLTLIMMAIGAVGLSILAVPFLPQAFERIPGWEFILAAILSGAFSIGLGNLLWSFGVKILGPSRTANFNNLVPVLAFVLSYITLHEELVAMQFVGAAVTITGVWIARR
jgi:drug/metabolite transporter (DMT)-like permease